MRLAQRIVIRWIRTKFKMLSAVSKRKAAEQAFRLFCTPQFRNRKKLPPIFHKAEQLRFVMDGFTIYGYRWKPDGAGKKALILHGFESTVTNFDHYVKPLMRKGYEVLAFDAPAHGRSSGKTITVLTYKKMIRQIYAQYGPIDSFMSHSFGGLSLSLALEEIPHDAHHKVVLIAPAVETTTAIDNFFRFLRLDKEVRVEFDKVIEEMGGRPPSWYSVARAAPHIKAKVLFLQDRDDEMTPMRDVEPIMHQQLPNFHFIISEGLGHRRIYRDNKTLKAIVEFL